LDDDTPIEFRRSLTFFNNPVGDTIVFYTADSLPKTVGIPPPSKQKENYLTKRFFIQSNIHNKTFKRVISIPKESIYYGNDYFSSLIPIYCINKEKHFIDVNFPNEQKIYRYDINKNYRFIKTIDLGSDLFGDVEGIPWGKKPDNVLSFIQRNSNYTKIFSFGDTLVTFYFKGLQEDEINFSIEKMNEEILKIPKCIQLFINEKKIGKDIILPKRIQHITYVYNLNRIIFYKGPNEFDENNNTNTFLIGKIDFNL